MGFFDNYGQAKDTALGKNPGSQVALPTDEENEGPNKPGESIGRWSDDGVFMPTIDTTDLFDDNPRHFEKDSKKAILEDFRKISETERKNQIFNHTDNVIIHQQDAIKFLRSLEAESIDLIVTDPAYSGMNQHLQLGKGRIVGEYKDKSDDGKWFNEFHDNEENYRMFLTECHRVLRKDSHIFIMFDSFSLITLSNLVRSIFNVKNIITWDKVNIGMGHYFRRQSEFIMFACKGKKPISRRDIPDIWKIKRLHKFLYPTQKPVEVFEAMIAASRLKTDTEYMVCDPFLGSGSSAIASLRQGCKFVGSDISDKSVSMSIERVKAYMLNGVDICQPSSAVDVDRQKVFWK